MEVDPQVLQAATKSLTDSLTKVGRGSNGGSHRRNPFLFVAMLAILGIAASGGCGSTDEVADQDAKALATFIVVRHAEKCVDEARDPALSELGHARARRLANLLGDRTLEAVYATPYRRTRDTARPSASANGLQITDYDAAAPATTLAAQLLRAHPRGTVLVVGHSNTVADIVNALSGQRVEALTEAQFDVILEVRIDSQGRTSVMRSTY